MLPEGMRGLAAYEQWCVWKLVQRPNQPKPAKLPLSGITGLKVDHTNPDNLTNYETALATSVQHGMNGVAFVFLESDPYFFLDIDGGTDETGQWSAMTNSLINRFPGAAIELSQSGTGLHIFGRCEQPFEHKKKNKEHGIELYTSKRFVALTLNGVTGNVDVDFTPGVNDLVEEFFKPDDMSLPWATGGRDPGWCGPEDDDELIQRARNSLSVRSVAGSSISFSDLFDGKPEELQKHYPDNYGNGRPWDGSGVDAALAMHLAFWTGRDAERIERLMWKSSLVREKWTDHKSYMQTTVQAACTRANNVYNSPKDRVITTSPIDLPESNESVFRPSLQFMPPDQQVDHFKGCVYVAHHGKVMVPGGRMYNKERFKAMYGGWLFALDSIGDKTSTDAFAVFTESQAVAFPKVFDEAFRPDLEPGKVYLKNDEPVVNSYFPASVERKVGDPTPFLTHLHKLLPNSDDYEIMLSYMAAIVQYPGVKFQWCPLLIGTPGNGKTLCTYVVAEAVGEKYHHVVDDVETVKNGFNAWIDRKIFIGFEDVYSSKLRREIFERLKPIITNSRQAVTPKGVDSRMAPVIANIIMNSNHKDALPKDNNDRRLCIFHAAQQNKAELYRDGMNGAYFPELYAWLRREGFAIMTEFLHSYSIPDKYNPATMCHRAPLTSTTDVAIEQSRGNVEQEIVEAIEQCVPGFCGGWVSSIALANMLDRMRLAKAIPQNRRPAILEDMGYIPHPALNNGRTNAPTATDQKRPRLFIKADNFYAHIADPKEVVIVYDNLQREAGAQVAQAIIRNVAQ